MDVVTTMPTWEGFLAHVLRALADGQTLAKRDLVERVADVAELTPEQRLETITSGGRRYQDRIGWSMSSLVRAEAIERPSRAHYRITATGHQLLEKLPTGIAEANLREIPAYRDYVPSSRQEPTAPSTGPSGVLDPRERISAGIEQIHADVAVCCCIGSEMPALPSSSRWSSICLWRWATGARTREGCAASVVVVTAESTA